MTILVQGGPANSGKKRIKRSRIAKPWTCECGDTHPPYLARCSRCRQRRPEEDKT